MKTSEILLVLALGLLLLFAFAPAGIIYCILVLCAVVGSLAKEIEKPEDP